MGIVRLMAGSGQLQPGQSFDAGEVHRAARLTNPATPVKLARLARDDLPCGARFCRQLLMRGLHSTASPARSTGLCARRRSTR
jgi:hypothetical protein